MCLVKTKEAAQMLGVSALTLRLWIKDGVGPECVWTPGGKLRFSQKALEEWIRERSRRGPREEAN